ncbi:PASTA domain-containing protein [Streptomyces sp. NPDC087859]|uniref:PASTA domain-containing protein n=1 Tax=Streptomyces sp. NPDC087859 TaxID=3365812 RepID=UPI00380A79B4
MRTRAIAAAVAAAVLLMLTACDGGDDTSPSKTDSTEQETKDPTTDANPTDADTSPRGAESEPASEAESATLPNLVGRDLQTAQDEAQAAGFYVLDDQDASGQNRLQVYDRNWTVCSQEPEAGRHPTDTPVTLFAVKDDESC